MDFKAHGTVRTRNAPFYAPCYFLWILIQISCLRSEGSSDSENYIPVTRDAGDPFSEGIDYGSEALEEERVDDHSGATLSLTTPTTDNHSFASSYKRRDLVSRVFLVHYCNIVVHLLILNIFYKSISENCRYPWQLSNWGK